MLDDIQKNFHILELRISMVYSFIIYFKDIGQIFEVFR